ncbi:MAG: hypothetical protein COT24_00465 [Candidatus Kerfeldbacteria bacterium CG08_land_8_20_14_0_20_40_16]|uniref:HNH nuclease domain-containing protein n=1 Tax=Candidatus Kerfeldbacteria bacterium CG08_land_8_20_14_0_20_40_16 TaxID=2014244 RepID=A0A2H0YWX8_9BACT|nr:MAG: hypothetical protein COT24_00465 [Candidatus Kerfeldbacteria bacterium CG08_land_8_20_14_0_20_40_16]
MSEKRKYADRAEYIKMAVSRRRKSVRKKAIQYKGGKCILCGYNKCKQALEFHHLKGGKGFGISAKGYTRKWENIIRELDKCVLVCANCHRELHDGLTQLPKEILE